MEIIQALAGFLVALLVVSALAQLLMSWALQVIAEKNELPDFAAFLSWIPLLNLYPLIRCGGGSLRNFVLGIVGCVVLGGASAVASATVGGVVAAILLVGMVIGFIVYFARIVMNTAQSRGISKWFGLLSFVPIVNFFVYPYIAFHDGFRPPHKIGVVLGLLIALGPIPGQMKMLEQLQQGATAFEAAQNGDFAALAEAAEGAGLGEMLEQMGPAMEIGAQLASLQAMDPTDPQQAQAMRAQADDVRRKLAAAQGLDGNARGELEAMLAQVDASLSGQGDPVGTIDVPDDVAPEPTGRIAAGTPPAEAVATAPLTDSIPRHGDLGYDVPATVPCAPGTEMHGGAPPEATKQWCSLEGGLKHGWLTEWHENGKPAVAGEYQNGLKAGIWTRWHPNGEKRAQAEFREGQQDGVLIAWDERGDKVHESRFEGGLPASRY